MANVMPGLRLDGVAEFQQLMRELGPTALTAGVKAMRKAMAPVLRNAKSRLKIGWGYGSGQLKKSLGVLYAKAFKREQKAKIKIGPRAGFATSTTTERTFDGTSRRGKLRIRKRKHDPRFIAHLVEFGHRVARGGRLDFMQGSRRKGTLVQVKGTGKHQGEVKPMPFLRPAFDAHRVQAIGILKDELRASLEKMRAKKGQVMP